MAKSDSLEQLQARLRQDPFQKQELVKEDIIPFDATVAVPLQGLR